MTPESIARENICLIAASLFARGLTGGTSGNLSIRIDDGWIMTPSGSSLGTLDPGRLSKVSVCGRHVSGDAPTKEALLHRVMYEGRRETEAVVHLHSTHSVAVSCLCDIDHDNVLPPITAYYVMRIGRLPLIPYFAPGDPALAEAVRIRASDHHAVLLANHGPIVAGNSIEAASAAIEELEETARLHLLLQGRKVRYLTEAQIKDLKKRFG